MEEYTTLSYADKLELTWPNIGRKVWGYQTHSVREYLMKVWKKEVASKDVQDTGENRTEEADKILRWWWEKRIYAGQYCIPVFNRDDKDFTDNLLKNYLMDRVNAVDNTHPPPRQ